MIFTIVRNLETGMSEADIHIFSRSVIHGQIQRFHLQLDLLSKISNDLLSGSLNTELDTVTANTIPFDYLEKLLKKTNTNLAASGLQLDLHPTSVYNR